MHYKGSIAEVFEKNDSGIYKGKLINKYLSFRKNGDYKLDFKIVSKNSKYLQAIVLLLNSDFKGMLTVVEASYNGTEFYTNEIIEIKK